MTNRINPYITHTNPDDNGFTTETIKIGWRFSAGHIPDSFNGYWIEIEGGEDASVAINMTRDQMKAIRDKLTNIISK